MMQLEEEKLGYILDIIIFLGHSSISEVHIAVEAGI